MDSVNAAKENLKRLRDFCCCFVLLCILDRSNWHGLFVLYMSHGLFVKFRESPRYSYSMERGGIFRRVSVLVQRGVGAPA